MDKAKIINVLDNMQQEISTIILLLNNADISNLHAVIIESNCKQLEIKNKFLMQVAPQEQETNKKCPCCKVNKHKADFINKNCTKINKTCNSCVVQINECIKTKKENKQENKQENNAVNIDNNQIESSTLVHPMSARRAPKGTKNKQENNIINEEKQHINIVSKPIAKNNNNKRKHKHKKH